MKPGLVRWRGRVAVCRLAPHESTPGWAGGGRLVSVTRTVEELSIVCDEAEVPESVRAERGWVVIAARGPIEFTEVGVLSAIAAPLAAAGISILALATFDTDYVLVREGGAARAVEILRAAGFVVDVE